MEIGQRIGMVLLFSLMAFAIFNDIQRLVGGS
jgi:regulator of sigma E protease